MRKLKAMMVLAVLCTSLTTGLTAYADVPPQGATRQLQIAITGHITAKCSLLIPGPTALSFGDILDNRSGSAADAALDVPFTLDCNCPYIASLTSRHGGLAFDGPRAENFAILVGYAARVNLSTRAGGVSLTCASSQMRGDTSAPSNDFCRSHSGAGGAADGKMTLTIRGGGMPLLRGTYSDELVLLVSPDLGG